MSIAKTLAVLIILTISRTSLAQASGPTIEVHLSEDSLPAAWVDAYHAEATELARRDQGRLIRIVADELARYDQTVLGEALVDVTLVHRLSVCDMDLVSNATRDRIFVASHANGRANPSVQIRQAVHFHVASILLGRYPQFFPATEWHGLLPHDFAYVGSGLRAIKEGRGSRTWTADMAEAGFLYEYAQASRRADLASIASWLMTDPDPLWRHARQYPDLFAKVEIVNEFLMQVDPTLRRWLR